MKTFLLIVLQLAASGSDAYFTHKQLASRGVEFDPIARPFVRTTTGQVAYFGSTAAISIAVPYELRKHRHERLADLASIAAIADSATGAAQSAIHQ